MANLSGLPEVFHGDTISTDSAAQVPVGTRAQDVNGNQYVYLQGTASTTGGSWVTFKMNTGYTALLTGSAVGPVAIAGTSITAGLFGWYQIYGKNAIAKSDTVAAGAVLYVDGTDGRVDDAANQGNLVLNAYSLTADTSNVLTVWVAFPSCNSGLIAL